MRCSPIGAGGESHCGFETREPAPGVPRPLLRLICGYRGGGRQRLPRKSVHEVLARTSTGSACSGHEQHDELFRFRRQSDCPVNGCCEARRSFASGSGHVGHPGRYPGQHRTRWRYCGKNGWVEQAMMTACSARTPPREQPGRLEGRVMNPLMPSVFEGTMAAAGVLAAGFAIAGFVSIVRTPMKPLLFLGWALFIFLIPFAGAGCWFRYRSRSALPADG